ncbi:hypothetical protein [Paraglaciecola psychrophila]|uniref:Uncharacterized protein n=1 Tax=Paraglaciecola psychrophila 170 TaxID=1129794 RepID=K6YVU4_9ALTE|nr:hypothetical protein [Paraglaciecola psychrophila]AGH44505.1 hypothetical protein C427_2396 [Paraglaciecola psychrophila 170]GAC36819.1 hypothetical protein GPSY_1182 [Paraglaciecola psychrophila 170]
MNRQHFNEQFLGMCEYFGKDHSESVIQIYWNALKTISDDEFTKAVTDSVMKSTFFPRVAELMKSVPKLEPMLIEDKGGLTWCYNTQRLMDKYGPNAKRAAA